jgi:hypothetical protein
MDLLPLKALVLLITWAVGAWLVAKVWKSNDPVVLKVVLTLLAVVPILGPLVVYWISNFPSRLHPDVQAKYKETVNVYGRWRTEDDSEPVRRSRASQAAKRR